jgi:hypothetical protein
VPQSGVEISRDYTTSVPVTSEMFLRGTLRALADFQRIHS